MKQPVTKRVPVLDRNDRGVLQIELVSPSVRRDFRAIIASPSGNFCVIETPHRQLGRHVLAHIVAIDGQAVIVLDQTKRKNTLFSEGSISAWDVYIQSSATNQLLVSLAAVLRVVFWKSLRAKVEWLKRDVLDQEHVHRALRELGAATHR